MNFFLHPIESTYASRYMNYQTEDAYVNPNNLTKAGPNIHDLYKKENRSTKKKDKPQVNFKVGVSVIKLMPRKVF